MATDVWIFQIPGTLDISANKKVLLSGGADAKNIFWAVAGTTTLEPGSTFKGNILGGPGASTIAMQNGAILNGRASGQTDVTLIGNTVSAPASTPGETCSDITLVSNTSTQFKGLTTTDPVGLSTDTLFTAGTPGASVVATPTGFPGAWDTAAADPDVSGADWVNNSTTQPTNPAGTNPGEDGTVDAWRLFSAAFTIPASATSISSPVLHFTSDNSVEAFLDNTSVGTASSYLTVTDSSPLSISTGNHEFEFVVKNDAYDGANNPTGLLYKAVANYCVPTPPESVQVHIFKYIDGVKATASTANNSAFPMVTTFNSPNLGPAVDAPFTLSPTGWGSTDIAYEASFVGSNPGADYAAHEVVGGDAVGAECTDGKPFALVGYTTGDTLADAAAATPSTTIPSFTNLQSDHYAIVWNKTCTSHLIVQKTTLPGPNGTVFTINASGTGTITGGGAGTVTDAGDMSYEVTAGTYSVVESETPGWNTTSNTCNTVVVAAGAAASCLITNTKQSSISGTKYNDLNRNGKKDVDEPGLVGWVIKLKLGNAVVATTTTDASGNYTFQNIAPGTYKVRETQKSGWKRMSKNPKAIVITSGSVVTDVNFGNALKKKTEKEDTDKDCDRDEQSGNYYTHHDRSNYESDHGKKGYQR